jgi:alanine racemase
VLPIDEVAAAAGTVGYELMCALARRVPVQTVDGDSAAALASAAP